MRRRRIASHGNSVLRARSARKNFCSRKELILSSHASGERGASTVVVALEQLYEKQRRDFLHSGASAAAWLEHGPGVELEEVRAASKDPALWCRLVDKYAGQRRDASGARS